MSLFEENGAKVKSKAFLLLAWPSSVAGTLSEGAGSRRVTWPPGSPSLGLSGDRGLKCSVRRYHGQLNRQMQLWKHKVLSHRYANLVNWATRQAVQSISDKIEFKPVVWNCPGFLWLRVDLEYCMWGRWYVWKPKVFSCPPLYTTSFLLLMVQEGLCCSPNVAKSSAVLISTPV